MKNITATVSGITPRSAPQAVLGMLALALCKEAGIEPQHLRARLLSIAEGVRSEDKAIQEALDQQMALLLLFLPE